MAIFGKFAYFSLFAKIKTIFVSAQIEGELCSGNCCFVDFISKSEEKFAKQLNTVLLGY